MVVRRLRDDELYHHGVKGQRWGVRRYQNPDGTLTAQGEARLAKLRGREIGIVKKRMLKAQKAFEKQDAKLQKKIDKRIERGGNADKLADKSAKRRESYEKGKSVAEKEIKALQKYKISDFAKEKNNLNVIAGREITKAAVASAVGTMTLNALFGGVYAAGGQLVKRSYKYIALPGTNMPQEKTRMRLASLEKGGVRTLEAEAIENRLNNARNEKQKTKFQEQLNEQLEKDKRRYG